MLSNNLKFSNMHVGFYAVNLITFDGALFIWSEVAVFYTVPMHILFESSFLLDLSVQTFGFENY